MVFALLFMVGLTASLVMVSGAATYRKKVVRECRNEPMYRPSQQILDTLLAMSPAEKISLFPTLSMKSTDATGATSELAPGPNSAQVRIGD